MNIPGNVGQTPKFPIRPPQCPQPVLRQATADGQQNRSYVDAVPLRNIASYMRTTTTRVADFFLPYARPKSTTELVLNLGSLLVVMFAGGVIGNFGAVGGIIGGAFGIAHIVTGNVIALMSSDPSRSRT